VKRLALAAAVLCLAASASASAAAPAPAPAATARAPLKNANVFGKRYCELFAVHKAASGFVADVYNTFGINDCPQATWTAIDTTAVATTLHALAVVRNGPRFWLMNKIEKFQHGHRVIKNLGGLRMADVAQLILSSLSTAPFTTHMVDRATTFTWNAGSTVYELRGPGGSTWVMQSYSRQIDPALSLGQLATLAAKLQLPAGWSYRVKTLKRPLAVVTVNKNAQVVQDNLDDTYSRVS
jgi:hypothetical protein